jgi:tetratricopeptide (TPR) repeat protein
MSMLGRRRLRLAGWLVMGVLAMRTAHAASPAGDEVDPEARRWTEEGLRQFNAGHFTAAIDAFQAAYRRTPAPALLYNLAQAYRLQKNCPLALESYGRYLETNPAGKLRALTEERITEMRACVLERNPLPLSLSAPAPAPAPGDGNGITAGLAPAPSPAPAASPAPVAAQQRVRPRKLAAIGAGLAAGGLLAACGYFAWQSHQASNEVTQVFRDGQSWNDAARGSEERGMADQRRALGLGVVGLVVAGVAAWLGLRR